MSLDLFSLNDRLALIASGNCASVSERSNAHALCQLFFQKQTSPIDESKSAMCHKRTLGEGINSAVKTDDGFSDHVRRPWDESVRFAIARLRIADEQCLSR
jgi:hypothetical protein